MTNNPRESNKSLYKVLRTVLHVVGCAQFSYSVYFDWTHVKVPREKSHVGNGYGGKFQYLTFWDAILQAVYFGLCIINDVFGSNEINPKNKPIIRKVKDYVLSSLAFPLAMFVGLTFWGLMAIDRELVFPKILDLYFPTWLNHVMHTNIMIFMILEVITTFRKYPTRASGVKGLLLFMVVYLTWTHVIFYQSGEWVYPICDVLNWWQRNIFFASMCLFAAVLYFVGEFFNNQVWAKEVKQLEGSKKGRKKENKSSICESLELPPISSPNEFAPVNANTKSTI